MKHMCENFLSEQKPDRRKILFKAQDLGVKYLVGGKREDYQSRAYNFLLKKGKRSVFWALKDVNIKSYAGDILGIIGLNGAGKTTLCRVISGLIRPDEGSVQVNGTVSALLSLGTGFNSELSGLENIYLNGMMLGFSKRGLDEIIDEIIKFSELEDFINQPLKNYSSGMKARLGFSIAAMFEPDILILDEALSTGDLRFSEKAGEKLQNIIGQSRMVILVSHRLNFVKKFCNRAIWIDKGRISASGSPEAVVDLYTTSAKAHIKKKTIKTINFPETGVGVGTHDVVQAQKLGVQFSLATTKDSLNKDRRNRFLPFGSAKKKVPLWALKNVDFNVREGEIVGIIGPNAAGKTTLCRVLSGILKPDVGKVDVKGKVTALLTLGTGFEMQLSGQENIFLNGMMLGFSKKELQNLYPDILNFSEIGDFINQPVKNYSSGMRARLGFSIVAMLKPDVFIIDEALNTGDINFFEKSAAKIQELMMNAKATLVVTHNIDFVKKVCTMALWLDRGQVVFQGDPKQAVDLYSQSIQKSIGH